MQFSVIEAAALVVLLSLAALKWKSERGYLARDLAHYQTSFARSLKESAVDDSPEIRGHRAMALMCAAICWRGDPTDSEGMLGVADEFLQYIEGNNSVMPRPDKPTKGQIPRAR